MTSDASDALEDGSFVPMSRLGRPRSVSAAVPLDEEPLRADELAFLAAVRPKTRADCASVPRPCPFVGCRHHLYLDINEQTGSLKVNRPGIPPAELTESCSLDVADRGEATLREVGLLMNITRERARQIEVRGLLMLRAPASVVARGADDASPPARRGRGHRIDHGTRARILAAVKAEPELRDVVLAERFGVSVPVIRRSRVLLGLPAGPLTRRRRAA